MRNFLARKLSKPISYYGSSIVTDLGTKGYFSVCFPVDRDKYLNKHSINNPLHVKLSSNYGLSILTSEEQNHSPSSRISEELPSISSDFHRMGCTVTRSLFSKAGESRSNHFFPVQVGEVREMERVFTLQDVMEYARVGGDSNPIHVSKDSAMAAGFKDTVVHGMLYAGLFPAIIGSHYPGAVYISQTLRFTNPVLTGERIRAKVQVTAVTVLRKRFRVTFATFCYKVDGSQVLEGTAEALLPPEGSTYETKMKPI